MTKFDIIIIVSVFIIIVWYLATNLPDIIKGF